MRKSFRVATALLSLATLVSAGCESEIDLSEDGVKDEEEFFKADSSLEATILDFEFDGELVTSSSFGGTRATIDDQMLYTIGHLNGTRGVGRLDRLVITDTKSTAIDGGKTKITYHAKLPVAWGSKTNLPSSYVFTLPKLVDYTGLDAFTTKYSHSCIDAGAHDVDSGSMWYYYRPAASGCTLAPEDVVKVTAVVTKSQVNSTGKYPEYHKVWEDDSLNVVAVFGKFEDGATTAADAGVSAYNTFVGAIKTRLAGLGLTTIPATFAASPGVATPDITFTATLAGGKKIRVNALLVDNVRTAGAAFDARYAELSTRADLIMYNGHAGLGSNVRALSQKGRFVAGQYLIMFMNGCDTYAYVDGSMAEARRRLNPEDVTGTQMMEIITNGMPSYFHSNSRAVMAMIDGLLAFDAPVTYENMFSKIDRSQVVLVTGDQDNVYFPGYVPGGTTPIPGPGWAGINESATVAKSAMKRWTTPVLPAGSYTFTISGTGGDADLYTQRGAAPSTTVYECRPYKNGSAESCTVTVTDPVAIHVMVRGYLASTFRLVGKRN